jgi:6-phosphogluconolactonase
MGEHGHTLSLFPGHPELAIDDVLVTGVKDCPKPPFDRITLTFGALTGARRPRRHSGRRRGKAKRRRTGDQR